jgi:hypothetical protein
MITTTTAPCISVIQDICSCKSHHHMIALLKYKRLSLSWSYGGVIYNYICHILLKYKRPLLSWSYGGVIYNYICHALLTTTVPCISGIHDICSCKSHHYMITTTTASCISVLYDIFSCKSHTYVMYFWNTRGRRSLLYGGVIYNYICHVLLKYKRPS